MCDAIGTCGLDAHVAGVHHVRAGSFDQCTSVVEELSRQAVHATYSNTSVVNAAAPSLSSMWSSRYTTDVLCFSAVVSSCSLRPFNPCGASQLAATRSLSRTDCRPAVPDMMKPARSRKAAHTRVVLVKAVLTTYVGLMCRKGHAELHACSSAAGAYVITTCCMHARSNSQCTCLDKAKFGTSTAPW